MWPTFLTGMITGNVYMDPKMSVFPYQHFVKGENS